MTRARLLLALSALALLAAAPAANAACTCTRYQNAQQLIGFSDVIFKGKAVSSKRQYGSTVTTFQVLEKLKGEPTQSVPVTHPAPGPNSCGGVAFKPGQIVVIVAQGLPEDLATTSCQINAYPEADLRRALR
jgi:hypothetical protein